MKRLIVFLIVVGGMTALRADEEQPKEDDKPDVEFDAEKIRPPDLDKGKPIARLFYDYIYPEDLRAKSAELDQEEGDRLTGTIFGALLRRYIEEQKFTAAPEEIEQYNQAMSGRWPYIAKTNQEKEAEQTFRREFAEGLIIHWKADRALYKKYGGMVIFQQFNPAEPVGAYRKFLEKAEKAKVFEVFDEHNQERFWHYFVMKHTEHPPETINFDQPWWLQEPDTPDTKDRRRPSPKARTPARKSKGR